jgi:ABC-type dipeptide/oligopeptide/nickel transport system permease component
MAGYLVRRAGQAVIVLLGAATIVFFAMRLIPGDPALVLLGPDADPAALAELRAQLGLDQPLITQYWLFLSHAAVLDLGESVRLHAPAAALVGEHLGQTAVLAATAMAIALIVSIPLGMLAAMRPDGIADRAVSVLSLVSQSLPTFWVGIMLTLVFSRMLHLLPSYGSATPAAVIMPAVTLALPLISVAVRLVRSSLLDVLDEDYIVTARAKGFGELRVVGVHGLRNALIPISTVLALEFGGLLGGAVIVETVFAWPGVGRLMTDSIAARDYAVVQACVLLVAAVFVVINFVVDVSYGFLDPRIRRGGTRS